MTNLALALAWKHSNAEGIATRDGVIFEWPDSLGAEPDAAAQATIIAEYEAHQTIIDEINRLEAQVTNRRLREAHADPTWLNAQEALIAAERAKL